MTSAAFQDPGGRPGPPSALFMPDMSAGAKAEDVHPYKDSNSNHRQEARLPRPGMPLSQGASTVQGITDQGWLLMMLNQREISARRGLVVCGPGRTGKRRPSLC